MVHFSGVSSEEAEGKAMKEALPVALVIEDEIDISRIIAKTVRAAGYEVVVIRSGDTAMTYLAGSTAELVVLDLNLPRVPGTDILRYIRGESRLQDTRVIVSTAFPRMAEEVREIADMVMMKPLDVRKLRAAAEKLMPDGWEVRRKDD